MLLLGIYYTCRNVLLLVGEFLVAKLVFVGWGRAGEIL